MSIEAIADSVCELHRARRHPPAELFVELLRNLNAQIVVVGRNDHLYADGHSVPVQAQWHNGDCHIQRIPKCSVRHVTKFEQ